MVRDELSVHAAWAVRGILDHGQWRSIAPMEILSITMWRVNSQANEEVSQSSLAYRMRTFNRPIDTDYQFVGP